MQKFNRYRLNFQTPPAGSGLHLGVLVNVLAERIDNHALAGVR
jgi:hypothetical protein